MISQGDPRQEGRQVVLEHVPETVKAALQRALSEGLEGQSPLAQDGAIEAIAALGALPSWPPGASLIVTLTEEYRLPNPCNRQYQAWTFDLNERELLLTRCETFYVEGAGCDNSASLVYASTREGHAEGNPDAWAVEVAELGHSTMSVEAAGLAATLDWAEYIDIQADSVEDPAEWVEPRRATRDVVQVLSAALADVDRLKKQAGRPIPLYVGAALLAAVTTVILFFTSHALSWAGPAALTAFCALSAINCGDRVTAIARAERVLLRRFRQSGVQLRWDGGLGKKPELSWPDLELRFQLAQAHGRVLERSSAA